MHFLKASFRAKNNRCYIVIVVTSFMLLFMTNEVLAMAKGRWAHYRGGGRFAGSNPSFSPDNSQVVFSSPATGHGDIYIINIDGSNRKQLTNNEDYEGEPVFSPDYSKICYVREEKGEGRIYIMNINGQNLKRLTSQSIYDDSPLFSSDSKKIIFSRRGKPHWWNPYIWEVYMINTEDSKLDRLTHNEIDEGVPTFSLDGSYIYYFIEIGEAFEEKKQEIWRMSLTTMQPELILLAPMDIGDIYFSRDMKKIVFISFVNSLRAYQVFIMNIDGTAIKQLTATSEYKSSSSFSYDGSKIMFLSEPKSDGRGNIMIMNSDGTNLKIVGPNY